MSEPILRLPQASERKKRQGPPRTNDPVRMARIAREAGEVIDSVGFRTWYEQARCQGAPGFQHYYAYVRASLGYDVPGWELSGLVWEATAKAFVSFDATRGDQAIPVDGRFLTHWRAQLGNLASRHLRPSPRTVPLPPDLAGPSEDAFDALIAGELREAVQELTADEKEIVLLRCGEGVSFRESGLRLKKRKKDVIALYARAVDRLRLQVG
jgi:DNA-directed RNA polymerase specialized sigma24 family protein